MRKQRTGKSVNRDMKFGIFSFFTCVGFLDIGFKDKDTVERAASVPFRVLCRADV